MIVARFRKCRDFVREGKMLVKLKNKNLAIADRSRVSYACTQYVEGIYRPKYLPTP